MITKSGHAQWEGDLKTGEGHISTESQAIKDLPYGFNKRFEGDAGTNPEELIGAAHAACFAWHRLKSSVMQGLQPIM